MRSRGDAWAWGLVALAAAIGLAMILHRISIAPEGRIILQDPSAPWIMAPFPFTAKTRQLGHVKTPRTHFTKRFRIEGDPTATLELRSFGTATVKLNGEALPLPNLGGQWKWTRRIDVSDRLRPGPNALRVEVRNLDGPGLLSLRLEAGPSTVVSDETWRAWVGARKPARALLADDRMEHPGAARFVSPGTALGARWPALAALAAAFTLAALQLGRRVGRVADRTLYVGAFALVTLGWIGLLAGSFWSVALEHGFDARKHLEYLDVVAHEGRLPIATDGWSMYHPPLFYWLSAALAMPAEWLGAAWPPRIVKAVSFAAGLGLVWQSLRLARRLAPGARVANLAALAFAATLPMNLYVAAYFTNESLSAFLCAGALVAGVDALLEPRPRPRTLAVFSTWLGLALLAKFTALVCLAVGSVFVGARILALLREDRAAGLRCAAAFGVPVAALSGWFYLRNLLLFGRPIVGNWNLDEPGRAWWSPPGFHTLDYYTRFGRSLTQPIYSAFDSFWDALYSTLWGDALLGGAATLNAATPQWNYEWMLVGFWLAVPLTALLVLGGLALMRDTLTSPEPSERRALGFLLTVVGSLAFAMLYTTLALPYFGQAKAFYALCATPVLALAFGRGYALVDRAIAARATNESRAIFAGCVAVIFGVFYLTYLG